MDGFTVGLTWFGRAVWVYCRYTADKEREVIQRGPDGWKVMQVRQRQMKA